MIKVGLLATVTTGGSADMHCEFLSTITPTIIMIEVWVVILTVSSFKFDSYNILFQSINCSVHAISPREGNHKEHDSTSQLPTSFPGHVQWRGGYKSRKPCRKTRPERGRTYVCT